MALRDRFIFWNGENLKEYVEGQEYPAKLVFSNFSEELPKPKVIRVSVPFGADLDITERLGQMAYSDGTHTISFLLWADSRVHLNTIRDRLIAKLHGVYASYYLDWTDSGQYEWMYNGRAEVSVEHRGDTCDVITVDITRSPWRISWTWEVVELDCMPTATLTLEGSRKYGPVEITTPAGGWKVKVADESEVTYESSLTNYKLADMLFTQADIVVTAPTWIMYMDEENEDLVVSSDKFSISGNDATIDSPYTVTEGDMYFTAVGLQKATIRFLRYDI